jgi:hypothetical protein
VHGQAARSPQAEAVETILMRALEKDAGARYQSAWEMQYDLDRFLANNEFTPSNQHLATFMKQLFADEIEAERARLSGRGVSLDAMGERMAHLDVDKLTEESISGPHYPGIPTPRQTTLPGRAPMPADQPQAAEAAAVAVPFPPEELAQLSGIAARHGIAVEALVLEIVQGYLRFR